MSIPSDVAQAVADALNTAVTAGTFSPWTFAAHRTYLPPRELDSIQDLVVPVLASEEAKTANARGKDSFLVTIQVGVCKRIDLLSAEGSNEEIDALMDLTQSISDELRASLFSVSASWQASRRSPLYDSEALQKAGVFLSVSEHNFLVIRNTP